MIADELRRQADNFIELATLANEFSKFVPSEQVYSSDNPAEMPQPDREEKREYSEFVENI